MPLNANVLGGLIKTEIIAAMGSAPVDDAILSNIANAIGKAVVEHIQADALVSIDQAQVTTGQGAGGTVTGTGKVT